MMAPPKKKPKTSSRGLNPTNNETSQSLQLDTESPEGEIPPEIIGKAKTRAGKLERSVNALANLVEKLQRDQRELQKEQEYIPTPEDERVGNKVEA